MRHREPFAQSLAETLESGWSAESGAPTTVRWGHCGGQTWRERRLFGAFTVSRPTKEVRYLLRDSIRFTPVAWRLPAQWILGTVAATQIGLIFGSGDAFTVQPPIPDARRKAVVPGNLRVRVFDYERGLIRVLAKKGFDGNRFEREIAVRATDAPGPFPSIRAFDVRAGWFEEGILESVDLPRCAPTVDRTAKMLEAASLVEAWAAPSRKTVEAAYWARHTGGRLEQVLTSLEASFGPATVQGIRPSLDALIATAGGLESIATTVGHGDLQPGNIMVARDGSVQLIDWEHSARRFELYDRMVLGLASRAPTGLERRVERFLDSDALPVLQPIPRDRAFRAGAVAMLLLEDLLWYASECTAGPFIKPSAGFLQLKLAVARAVQPILAAVGRR